MRRLVLVCLFVLTSMATWAPGISAETDGLPKAPQSKGDGLEFSVEGAIADDRFGSPLNWGPNEDGRLFLLVTINVRNTNSDSRTLNSSNFRIVSGSEFISADDGLSKRPGELDIPAMGDVLGDVLDGKKSKLYVLGWRLEPKIDEYILDIDYGSAKPIDLQPWLDLDIKPGDLRPTQSRSSAPSRASSRASSRPTATVASRDDEITADEQDYLDAIDEQQTTLYTSVDRAGDLFNDASDDLTLIRDQTWIVNVAVEFVTWQTIYTDAQALKPSDRQQPIQDVWLELAGLVSDASHDYTTFIDNVDASAGEAGVAKINQATLLIPVLQGLIKDFEDDPASFTDSVPTTSVGNARSVSDCTPFATYEEAEAYYADHPDAQPIIDPDQDGQACEVYFGRG